MDDDQQFCLRWNNHQSTLVAVFDTLLEKGMHVDCTLAAEGQTLKAHKVVLSACSPYFESVLSQQYDKHPIIILKDVKYAELRAMMDYMYRGEVNISQDQLAALLKAAESLQIKGLSDNKPSRPPSRPAPPAQPHLPRPPSPQPLQGRDGSVDSRSGSESPSRRRKKARRTSLAGSEAAAEHAPAPAPLDEPLCKDERERDGVEDLTLDDDHDDHPPVTHNDVVRNFQWHMERSQDEIMNSSDSVRESQDAPTELTFAKTPFPITRRFLKMILENDGDLEAKSEQISYSTNLERKIRKALKKRIDENKIKLKKMLNSELTARRGPGRPRGKGKHRNFKLEHVGKNRNFKPHVVKDENIKPLVVKDEKMKRRVVKKENLKTHVRKYKKLKVEKGKKLKPHVKKEKKAEPHVCSICHKKTYKYRRNKLRHERYECVSGPQFACDECGKKYSQKKSLTAHVGVKHAALHQPLSTGTLTH